MLELVFTSIVWAFSFSIIKGKLIGIPSDLISFIRLALSFAVFAPFIVRRLTFKNLNFDLKLIAIGSIQFGLMYLFYIKAFLYLAAFEIAMLTVFTPIFVTLIEDLFNKKINYKSLGIAVIATLGAFVISYNKNEINQKILGFMLIQISNFAFAFGQVAYKRIYAHEKNIKRDTAFLYLGGVIITFLFSIKSFPQFSIITKTQFIYLAYLGVIASGLCFFLWNRGATKVSVTTLAVMNNLKVPLGVLVAFVFLQENINLSKLTIGSVLIALALFLNSKYLEKFINKKGEKAEAKYNYDI